MPKPKVAWFCAALWQDFTPPLTPPTNRPTPPAAEAGFFVARGRAK